MKDFFKPHRVVLIVLAVALVTWCILSLNWTWLENPKYQMLIVQGIWRTIWIVVVTMVIGMILAVPIGLAQAAGPWYVSAPARVFCTQEELANVKELASSLNDITTKFGQLKVEKLNLLTQISALEELENSMDKEYFELKEKEYTLSKELSEKYGEGTLNLETGAIS